MGKGSEQSREHQNIVKEDVTSYGNIEEPENQAVVKNDQAIAIAREVIGDIEFDKQSEILVERLEGKIRVIFPINKETPPGTRYRGPDYATEVYIDAQSGKVLQTRQGS